MKGLLIKDLRFTLQNKKMMIILLFVAVWMLVMQGAESGPFIISYMTMICGIMVLNTISIDEFDKSDTFLMTMPIERKTYATEKYVFAFGCTFFGWLVSAIPCLLIQEGDLKQNLIMAVVLYAVFSFFEIIILPIQLKFGGEKGRMVLLGIIGAIFALAIIAKKIAENMFATQAEAERWINEMVMKLESLNPWSVALVVAAIWIAGLTVSLSISKKIMENKEY